jgi:hypothetical protein
MKSVIRQIPGIRSALKKLLSMLTIVKYRLWGSPVPPPHIIKVRWLASFGYQYSIKTLVETGTYQGTTILALLDKFETIYTIELSQTLWNQAVEKLNKYNHIHVINGDSSKELRSVLNKISDRCLFWLDGHFSGGNTARGAKDSPIIEELETIRQHCRRDHIILIDDARCFNGSDGYPTLSDMKIMLHRINPNYIVKVRDDIIQAYLPKTSWLGNYDT